jgi:steroid 5-alpha reductase family enzyme
MHPALTFLIGYALLVLIFLVAWLWQLRSHNAGMVDAVWSYSLGILAVCFALLADGDPYMRGLTALFGGVWGGRLGTHLWLRNAGQPEDGRYARLRETWGRAAARKMLGFFQLQAVFSMLLSLGFLVVVYQPRPPAVGWCVLAGLVWVVAVLGEALADRQLRRFKADPARRGRVCRSGLWRYSRHPNYFFECLHWLTYPCLALASPWVWLALLPPLVMAWLLLKVSGIPLTEAQTARSRPEYADYIRTTSALIPWPPKKST